VLYIDDRENPVVSKAIVAILGDKEVDGKGNSVVKRLSTGDYVMGKWGIEAKEINDLYRTILGIGRNRNLTQQLADLCDAYETPILAVYGSKLKPYFPNKVTKNTVANEIVKMRRVIYNYKLQLYSRFPKIRLIEFATQKEFIDWLVVSHQQMAIKKVLSAPKSARRGEIHKDPRIAALCGVRGIDEIKAEALLTQFKSIKQLLLSKRTLKDLMGVRGITKPTAERILALREEYQ